MRIETLLTDAISHTSAGVLLSLLDFITTKFANPKSKRLQKKKECLQSIEIILDTEKSEQTDPNTTSSEKPDDFSLSKDSEEYVRHLAIVREYLRTTGQVKVKLPVTSQIKDFFKNILFHEKINTLSNIQKFGVAFGVEVIYDILFDFPSHAIAGIAATLYQIPSFFVGLWLGNGIKKGIDILITPVDERKLDKIISQLVKESAITEIVMKNAGQTNQEQSRDDSEATQTAFQHLKDAAKTAQDVAETLRDYPQQQKEKEIKKEEERKARFDDLTKGR